MKHAVLINMSHLKDRHLSLMILLSWERRTPWLECNRTLTVTVNSRYQRLSTSMSFKLASPPLGCAAAFSTVTSSDYALFNHRDLGHAPAPPPHPAGAGRSGGGAPPPRPTGGKCRAPRPQRHSATWGIMSAPDLTAPRLSPCTHGSPVIYCLGIVGMPVSVPCIPFWCLEIRARLVNPAT
jgi:hypothetical protein